MILETIVIVIYSIALVLIFLYALAQLNLLFNYLGARKKTQEHCEQFDFSKPDEIPLVTIQLPVYNELYVIERLLDNIVKLEYPKDKLEIQVLDDSTDASFEMTAAQIKRIQATGIDIRHMTRKDRQGFKAGALKEGLKTAKGEFIAIFDADFLSKLNWLNQKMEQNIEGYTMLTKKSIRYPKIFYQNKR